MGDPVSCMPPFKYHLVWKWFPVGAMMGERFNSY